VRSIDFAANTSASRRDPLVLVFLLSCAVICLNIEGGRACAEVGLDYKIELTTASKGYDRKTGWVHARAGAIPPDVPANPSNTPVVVLTTQKLLLDRSDVFYGLNVFRTDDLGQTWSGPEPQPNLDRQRLDEHQEIVLSDFTPQWHATTGKLLGTGHTITYYDNYIRFPFDRWTGYSIYDPAGRSWLKWQKLELSDPKFVSAGAGCTQRYDLPNGDILLPVYYALRDRLGSLDRVTVLKCRFNGEKLTLVPFQRRIAYVFGARG
jgi:hypothetical protein